MYALHAMQQVVVRCRPNELFTYLDDPTHLSGHMRRTSWRLGGGKMTTELSEGN